MPQRLDLTGHVFGDLTVQGLHSRKGYVSIWLCKCKCGRECNVRLGNLRNRHTTSCGCSRRNDLSWQRFGRLTALCLAYVKRAKCGTVCYWQCKCDCGNLHTTTLASLVSGVVLSCGCYHREQASKTKHDLSGQRFERLLVIGFAERRGHKSYWKCKCDCGKEVDVFTSSLRNNHTRSCGCLQKEITRKRATTHGLSGTKEYSCYVSRMRQREKKVLDCAWTFDMDLALKGLQPSCVVCRRQDRLAVDHVLPLSKGYGLCPGNAVRLCASCNSKKGYKDLSCLPPYWQEKITKAAQAFADHWSARTRLVLEPLAN
jgi:hypothetical protein